MNKKTTKHRDKKNTHTNHFGKVQNVPNEASLTYLLNLLSSVDTKSDDAELNKTTISDNNGGRILL